MAFRSRSRGALRALLGFCAVLPLVQACGGRSDTEEYLFGDDPITVGASSSTGGGATAGRTGVGGAVGVGASAGFGASAGVGSTSPLGGTTGEAGEPSVGGASVVAGSGQGGVATAGTTGVAGAPSGPAITCGADVCDADTQTCCASLGGLQCVAKGTSCQGAVLNCTTNSDCGADVCCFSITGDVSAASSCKPQCSFMGGGRDRQLCEVDGDCRPPFRFCTPTVFGVNICTRQP